MARPRALFIDAIANNIWAAVDGSVGHSLADPGSHSEREQAHHELLWSIHAVWLVGCLMRPTSRWYGGGWANPTALVGSLAGDRLRD